MSERRVLLGLLGGGFALAAGIGALIYFEQEDIEKGRGEVQTLVSETESSRKTIESTPSLEREVIVLREMAEIISEILPDGEDVSNLIRTLSSYCADSGVSVTAWKPKSSAVGRGRARSAFDTVGYSLTLEGSTFELLDLLNRIETHSRLITVPSFKLTAASRRSIEDEGVARHSIALDVETYMYERKTSTKSVSIEGYERKRDLLSGEIARRRQALTLASFSYRGPRNRRDPWIDPRVPANVTDGSALSVPEQVEMVDALREEVLLCQQQWQDVEAAENMLEALVVRKDLEKAVARIQDQLREIESEGTISYLPAKKRLENDVYDPLEGLLSNLQQQSPSGPSKEVLIEIHEAMRRHIEERNLQLALDAFDTIERQVDLVESDPVRRAILDQILFAKREAEILRDFGRLELDVRGFAIIDDNPPAVLINGRTLGIGDRVSDKLDDLEILDIRANEIDFYFRGVVLTRIF